MNYDKYQFVLEWDELPEDFKEEKITEYIEKGEKQECEECGGTGSTTISASQEAGEIRDEETQTCSRCGGSGEVDPDPDDQCLNASGKQVIQDLASLRIRSWPNGQFFLSHIVRPLSWASQFTIKSSSKGKGLFLDGFRPLKRLQVN